MFFEMSYQEWCKKTESDPLVSLSLWRSQCDLLYERIKDIPIRSEFRSEEEYQQAIKSYNESRA